MQHVPSRKANLRRRITFSVMYSVAFILAVESVHVSNAHADPFKDCNRSLPSGIEMPSLTPYPPKLDTKKDEGSANRVEESLSVAKEKLDAGDCAAAIAYASSVLSETSGAPGAHEMLLACRLRQVRYQAALEVCRAVEHTKDVLKEKHAKKPALKLQGRNEQTCVDVKNAIPKLVITTSPGLDLEQLDVWVDGMLLSEEQLSCQLSIDPGVHQIVASRRMGEKLEVIERHSVTLAPRSSNNPRATIVELKLREPPSAPVKEDPKAAKVCPSPPREEAKPVHSVRWEHVFGAASFGLAGIGFAFSATSFFRWDLGVRQLERACPTPSSCPTTYQSLSDEGKFWRGATITSFVAGLVFAAGGIILVALPPSSAKDPPSTTKNGSFLRIGPGGFMFEGTF